MNFKNKLRMCFLMMAIAVAIYVFLYFFYQNTSYNDLGQGVLVSLPYIRG